MTQDYSRDDEGERRRLQEYIFSLEEGREQALKITLEHEQLKQDQESLVSHAPIGFVSIDRHGAILKTNQRLLEILGSPSEQATRTINVLTFPPLVDAGLSELFRRCMEDAGIINAEVPYTSKWGKELYFKVSFVPVWSLEGSVSGCYALIEDIIDRKKAEEALRISQETYKNLYEESKRQHELYRSLLNSSPDAIAIYDLEGRVGYVNDSFTRVFGWTIEELRDKKIPYVPDSEKESSMALIRSLVDDGVPCSGFESRRYTKDGGVLEVSLSASRYHDHEGSPAGMLVILSDITQRKLLEEQLRQSAKMEAIGQLAGGLAHDFNNILTAVIGYANLLSIDLPTGEPCQAKLLLITRAAERAADLTRQLLAFSRKQVLDVKVTSLNEIIADVERFLKRLIGEQIDLVTTLDPTAGRVQADAVQIQQILMNLAVNARDAMPEGGKLTIETADAFLDDDYARIHPEVRPGPYVMFAISDGGQGMDSKTLARIFEPFFTTKEKDVGTGLGLATVYGIVKQHQGHINVYSEPGRGTAFKVYLPRVEAPSDPPVDPWDAGPRPHGNETILVVEDEEIVRKLACEVLEILGYHAIPASSPREAIEICNTYGESIHLLLTDVVLPQMDGRRLFDALSLKRPDLKVLYVSGYTENFIVHHGVLDKGLHFMHKPFNVDNLAVKVRQILDGP